MTLTIDNLRLNTGELITVQYTDTRVHDIEVTMISCCIKKEPHIMKIEIVGRIIPDAFS